MNNKKIDVTIVLLIVIIILLGIILVVALNNKAPKYESPAHHITNESRNTIKENMPDNYISKEEALNIALKDAGLDKNSVHDIDVELDYEYNQELYEVSFKYDKMEYEYYIDPINKTIIKKFKQLD